MNVLHAIKGLGRGGAERIVADCAELGNGRSFRYEVAYCLSAKEALVPELRAAGVPVHRLADSPLSVGPALRNLVRERSIDVLHVHSPVLASLARLARIGVPVVYTEHNVWSRYNWQTRWLNAATYARNAHVFAVSDDVRLSISRRAERALHGRLETLTYGLHPRFRGRWTLDADVREELSIPPEAPVVVCVANFKPFKGHEHLLRAAALVGRSLPEARFVLAGVGQTEPMMRRLAEDVGLNGSVIFAGYRDDAPRLMALADVFVLPSEQEGLPIALLEAMALGRPSIATAVGGIPDVINDGWEGLLIPPKDPAELAAAIVALLSDEELRRRMGDAAKIRAADFDIRRAVARMQDVYQAVLP
jgi:glycosyltransferase involved in cell wall biosynthesis